MESSRKGFCEEAVSRTLDRFGRFDVLICNAAEQHAREEVIEISEEQRFRTCQTNIGGHFYMVQAALRILRRVHPSSARPPSPPIAGRTC
ncbi:SDR family oxidoreductase [Paracoccus aurantiacus]|uniref:SDR family oxidoreductase n=1 Tax=Paracoccus aurantiacus TaxID=2599412 RepID=UPI003629C8ED